MARAMLGPNGHPPHDAQESTCGDANLTLSQALTRNTSWKVWRCSVENESSIENVSHKLETNQQCPESFLRRPRGEQFVPNVGEPMAQLGHMVDRVYVLCYMNCDYLELPAPWGDTVLLMDAGAFDACAPPGLNVGDAPHGVKVTATHKYLAADAKMNGFHSILVLEEDFQFMDPYRPFGEDWDAYMAMYDDQSWGLLRLGWTWTSQQACEGQCVCHQTSPHMCHLDPGCTDMHSSVAYVLRASYYDHFANPSDGYIIDLDIFASVPSALAIPPLVTQINGGCGCPEAEANGAFLSNCLG